jgi:hypothetical protein
LILTDLEPEASDAGWYGLRAWIEQGFKITKRAGWQWHRTRMSAPDRAARLWLAIAVATLWLLSVGGEADATIPASTLLDVTVWCPERPRTRRATRLRLVSVFRQGVGTAAGRPAAPGAVAAGPLGAGTLARRAPAGGRPGCA